MNGKAVEKLLLLIIILSIGIIALYYGIQLRDAMQDHINQVFGGHAIHYVIK